MGTPSLAQHRTLTVHVKRGGVAPTQPYGTHEPRTENRQHQPPFITCWDMRDALFPDLQGANNRTSIGTVCADGRESGRTGRMGCRLIENGPVGWYSAGVNHNGYYWHLAQGTI